MTPQAQDEFGGIAIDQPAAEERDEFGGIAVKPPADEFGGVPIDREQHLASIQDPIAHAIQNPDDYESALEAQKRRDARPAGEKWAEAGQALVPGSGFYSEAAKEGVRFIRGLVQTPIHTALQAGATMAAPIARAVGVPQAGVDWIENEQLTHGAEATLAAQQAEISGRRSLRNIQRIPSGIGGSFMSLMGIQDTTTPASAEDYNARKLFDTKIAETKSQQSIAEGKPIDTGLVAGASQLATGLPPSQAFGPETIAVHGARQPDPETVASMAAVTDPTNVPLPFLNRIPGLDKVAGAAAEGIGYAAQAPGKVVSAGGRLVGKAGTFAKVAGGATAGGIIAAGGDVLNDPSGALIGAAILGGAKGLQWLGKGVQQSGRAMRTGTSDLVKEAALARITGKSAKLNTAQRFIGDTTAAGIATSIGDAPLNAAITEDPREFIEEQVGSGLMGMGFSAFQNSRPQLVEAARPYLRMRGEQSLDSNTPEGRRSIQILMQMPETQRNAALELLGALGNLPVRNAAGEMVPATMVFQTGGDYAAMVNKMTEAAYKGIDRTDIYNAKDKTSRKAARKKLVTAALNRINAAKTRGFAWIDGKAYINTDAASFSRPGEAGHVMGHEFGGHIAMRMLDAAGEKGGQIYEGLMAQLKRGLITAKGTPTDKFKAFISEYNRRMGSKQENPYDAAAQEEFLAETAGKIIAGGGIADAAMPKNLLDHVTNATGQFFLKFVGIDTRRTGATTGLNIDEVGEITREVRDTLAQLAGMKLREGKALPDPVETDEARIRELEEIVRQPRPPGTAPATEVDAWVAEQKAARSKLAELQKGQPPPFPAAGTPPVAPSSPSAPQAPKTPADIQRFNDAKAALMALGHKAGEAITAIREAEKQHGKSIDTTENLVKGAQRILQKLTVAPGQYEAGYVKPVAPMPAVDTTKTFKNVEGNQVKITGESADPVKPGDFVLTEGGNIRKVLTIAPDGSLNLNYPQSGDGRPTEIAKPGRFRVLATEETTSAVTTSSESPQNTVKPGPGGTFIIVDAAGNPINKRTYRTAESAQRVADGQGKAAKFKLKPNPNPEVPDVIDAVLEQGGINLSGLSKEEAEVFIRDRYLRTLLSDPAGQTPDEMARLLAQSDDAQQQAFGDGDLRTLGTLIEDAYRARRIGESAESAAAKAEAQARTEAAKQPTQPQSQPPQNATSPADTQTSESIPLQTNVAVEEPPARDAAPEPGALSRLQIDAIADEARESFLSDKAPAKSGANKGQHTKANQQAADKAAFQAVAQAHSQTLPPNYEGIKLTESPLGFPEVSGTVKPGRAFDDYLLELAGITPEQLKTIGDIQSRIGQTISVQYAHAAGKPGEPNYAATRKAAQAKSPAKGRHARGEGQEETKVFLPQKLKFNFGAKTFTVLGTNVEKLLGNFGWAEEAMQQAGEEMPYRDIHDPKLVADLKGLQANHDAGFTWDGNPIQGLVDRPQATNRPSADKAPYEGFLDEEGMPDLHRFEFLNLLLGNEGARTGKRGPTDIQKAKLTLGEMNRGDVSDPVTAEGETNQLRDRLNAALGPQEVLDADGNPTGETDRWSKVFMEDPLDEALSIENVTRINPEVERGTSPLHENDYRGDIDRHFGKLKPSNTEQERIAAAGRFLPEEAGAENASDAVKKRAAQLWREKGTESPFFKKWFGNSKVVDEKGSPLTLYRGGPRTAWRTGEPITKFKSTNGPWAGFFTDHQPVADMFARLTSTDGVITEAFVKIEKPYEVEANGKAAGELQFDLNEPRQWFQQKNNHEILDAIKSGTYDGVIIRNTSDEGTIYLPLKSEQIKSATSNEGTFDPKNPDIRFLPESRRSPNTPTPGTEPKNIHASAFTGAIEPVDLTSSGIPSSRLTRAEFLPEERKTSKQLAKERIATRSGNDAKALAQRSDLFWRVHDPKESFDKDSARSISIDGESEQAGYSTFSDPRELFDYWMGNNHAGRRISDYGQGVIAFTGNKVGKGIDGEPLSIPDMREVHRVTFRDVRDLFDPPLKRLAAEYEDEDGDSSKLGNSIQSAWDHISKEEGETQAAKIFDFADVPAPNKTPDIRFLPEDPRDAAKRRIEDRSKTLTPTEFLATFRRANRDPKTDEENSRQTISDYIRTGDESGETSSREAIRDREKKAVAEWAKANGKALYALPRAFDFNSESNVGGVEHDVWFDRPTQRYLKVTKPSFGMFPEVKNGKWTLSVSTPSQYLEKLNGIKEFSGVETSVHGAFLDKKDTPSLIVSQPAISGKELSQADIDRHMKESGFLRVDDDTASYYRPEDNFAAFDAHPGNMVEIDGKAVAFDGIFLHPKGDLKALIEADYEKARSRKPAPESPGNFMEKARAAFLPESRRSPKEMAQERIAKRAGKFMPEDARDIVPAIKINGKLVKGEKGMTHQDILDRHMAENPDDVDALMDFDTKANPNRFVGTDGQEISREQLKERFGVVDSQGLRKLQGGQFMPDAKQPESRSPAPRQRASALKIAAKDRLDKRKGAGVFLPEDKMTKTLYRAADSPEAAAGAHFSEKESDAKAYQDNPGFGGGNLYRFAVDDSRVADVPTIRDLASKLKPMLNEDQKQWAEENGGLETAIRDYGFDHVFQAMENNFGPRRDKIDPVELLSKDHDWIRFTDDFPEGAKTWRYIGKQKLNPAR